MMIEIITIIGVAITLLIAVITATWKISNSINTIKTEVTAKLYKVHDMQTRHGVKINILWDVYGEDALKEARTHGITAHRSPDTVTEKGIALLTDSMYNALVNSGNNLLNIEENPTEVAFQLFMENKELFERLSKEHNISLKAFAGIAQTIVNRCLDDKLGNNVEISGGK